MRTPSGSAFAGVVARRQRWPWLVAAMLLLAGCQREPPAPPSGTAGSAAGASKPAAPSLPAEDETSRSGSGAVPADLAVAIQSATGTTTITGDKIAALPREAMPGDLEQEGWRLTALLQAAGLTTYERLRLRDEAGASVALEREDFSERSIPFVRINRRGLLRFHLLQNTTSGWVSTSDLRGLIEIDAK